MENIRDFILAFPEIKKVVVSDNFFIIQKTNKKFTYVYFDKENNEIENLATLCRACNSGINHGGRKGWSDKNEQVKAKVKASNGLKIVDKEYCQSGEKYYQRDQLRVLNLNCEPYSNYFVEYLSFIFEFSNMRGVHPRKKIDFSS